MIDGLTVRPVAADDLAFVVDSWVESYRHAHAAGLIPMPHYQRVYREAVTWMLERPGVAVHVAVGPEDVLCGFAAVETGAPVLVSRRARVAGQLQWVEQPEPSPHPFVLYLYVKASFRGRGIACELLDAAGVDRQGRYLYASKTPEGSAWVEKHAPLGKWSPLVARFPKMQPLTTETAK